MTQTISDTVATYSFYLQLGGSGRQTPEYSSYRLSFTADNGLHSEDPTVLSHPRVPRPAARNLDPHAARHGDRTGCQRHPAHRDPGCRSRFRFVQRRAPARTAAARSPGKRTSEGATAEHGPGSPSPTISRPAGWRSGARATKSPTGPTAVDNRRFQGRHSRTEFGRTARPVHHDRRPGTSAGAPNRATSLPHKATRNRPISKPAVRPTPDSRCQPAVRGSGGPTESPKPSIRGRAPDVRTATSRAQEGNQAKQPQSGDQTQPGDQGSAKRTGTTRRTGTARTAGSAGQPGTGDSRDNRGSRATKDSRAIKGSRDSSRRECLNQDSRGRPAAERSTAARSRFARRRKRPAAAGRTGCVLRCTGPAERSPNDGRRVEIRRPITRADRRRNRRTANRARVANGGRARRRVGRADRRKAVRRAGTPSHCTTARPSSVCCSISKNRPTPRHSPRTIRRPIRSDDATPHDNSSRPMHGANPADQPQSSSEQGNGRRRRWRRAPSTQDAGRAR